MRILPIQFQNKLGYTLSARLELPPDQHPYAFAIFAHVFTGNKNLSATRHISRALTVNGFGVLRFDFTGLGESEGDFSDTNFSSNVEDLLSAAEYLNEHYMPPKLIVGHSLGGAAAVFAAAQIPSITTLATIGAPSEPAHVRHLLKDGIEEIKRKGCATINIAGREFQIKKHFLDDIESKKMFDVVRNLRKPILVLHSPQDAVVAIENAAHIYHAAYHPKSFVTLDGADHMLTDKKDAAYTGDVIATWASRYIQRTEEEKVKTHLQVAARIDDDPGYTTEIIADKHHLIADEPKQVGGNDFGPDPYELLAASLGACTVMTLKMYAQRKGWPLEEVTVHLKHEKKHAADCENCEENKSRLDHFTRSIEIEGPLSPEMRKRLLEIANKCPVHRTLHAQVVVETSLLEP